MDSSGTRGHSKPQNVRFGLKDHDLGPGLFLIFKFLKLFFGVFVKVTYMGVVMLKGLGCFEV